MPQLLTRLQQLTQRLGCSNLLPITAACSSGSSCSLWTATLWQQQQQQTQQQVQLLQQMSQLPRQLQQQVQQHTAGFSTSAAAADVAVLSIKAPPALPSVITSWPLKHSRSSNTVQYPYRLPPQYSSRQWQLRNLDGQPLGAVDLPGDVFNVPVRVDILNQVVRWQRAKARQGTHKVKDRSEVSGGGRKPWQQKGSGRARQGSIRAPQWRGGGIVHGPVPRSHAFDLPRKVRRMGLKCALSAKANEGRLILVDSLLPETPKTKFMAGKLENLLQIQAAAAGSLVAGSAAAGDQQGLSELLLDLQHVQETQLGQAAGVREAGQLKRVNAVLIDSSKEGEDGGKLMRRAVSNLPGIEVVPAVGANVLSILRRDYVIMTKAGLDAVVARLQSPINRLGAAGLAFRQKLLERRAAAARQQQLAPERRKLTKQQQEVLRVLQQ